MFKRPFIVCYICGREFGSASIGIHEPQCLEKWHKRNNLLPKSERLKPPIKPKKLSISGNGGYRIDLPSGNTKFVSSMNEAAEIAAYANLVPCPTCGRTFNPDRIDVHKRICKSVSQNKNQTVNTNSVKTAVKSDNSTVNSRNQVNTDKFKTTNKIMSPQQQQREGGGITAESDRPKETIPRKPITAVCYICGREYGTRSIGIHEPKCLEKWHRQNNELPPAMRRKPPERPVDLPIKSSNNYDLQKYNEQAMQSSKSLLVPCSICNRTFNPDRIEVHERICKKNQK
ncbi:unnamed protein product [Schistosoma turkestanicum]|nr:unnamed protein product [Schistosoma turkestanicum]